MRIGPDFHRKLATEARQRRLSLNRLCTQLMEAGLQQKGPELFEFLTPIVKQIQTHFQKRLLGVALFGSQVTGRATISSDYDLLIALEKSIPLTRALYQWWDENIPSLLGKTINPHFVHLPSLPEEAGGLWFEVATASQILWEDEGNVSSFLEKINKLIEGDQLRRYWSQGHPYWVRKRA